MAPVFSNDVLVWLLLYTSSFYSHLVCSSAEFPTHQHYTNARHHKSIAFLVVGDWGRSGKYNQSLVAHRMGKIGKQLRIDFVVSTGDNFYNEGLKGVTDPLFQRSFTNIYKAKSLQVPWYTVLGNHDYMGSTRAQLSQELRHFDQRWFCMRSFVVQAAGLVDIVFIDTTPFVDSYFVNHKHRTFDWSDVQPRDEYLASHKRNLDLVLKKSKAPWKIVVGHHTMRSIGHHGDTDEMVDQILPILEANKVSMYINGHDHCLEHLSNKEGTLHFLTSGGGSKAWKNDIDYGQRNDSVVYFYHDGQGFLAVKLKQEKARLEFYGVTKGILHQLKLYQ